MLKFRLTDQNDVDLYFQWANDKVARENSYNNEPVEYHSHVQWFHKKLESDSTVMYLYLDEHEIPVGQVRIDKDTTTGNRESIISISVDKQHRGKGYSVEMLQMASVDFLQKNPHFRIFAYIFVSNQASFKSFIKAGYKIADQKAVNGIPSYILEKSDHS